MALNGFANTQLWPLVQAFASIVRDGGRAMNGMPQYLDLMDDLFKK